MTATQQAVKKIDRYIRSKYPLIVITSHEETRLIEAITNLVMYSRDDLSSWQPRQVLEWSVTSGIQGCRNFFDPEETTDPMAAIEALLSYPSDSSPLLIFLKDFHPYIDNPFVVRALRDLANHFSVSPHTAILVSPAFKVPTDLEKTIVVVDWPLPDQDELGQILSAVECNIPPSIPVTLNGNRERLTQAMLGLTSFEAESVLLNAITATRELGDDVIPLIVSEKKQIVRKDGTLEFFDKTETEQNIGGLAHLKRYIQRKRATFSDQARQAGVEPAKGVMLVGVPGTGKSLSAKVAAGGQMPLLRMDVGALMGGLVGESESNTRRALKLAEAVAPAVVWIDEIEKSLGGIGGERDGGTTARVFGTILTWMAETTAPVYIIATANDVRSLKPELLRRFDDIFWVDLPNTADRVEIFQVHLNKRSQNTNSFDLDQLSRLTYGFTGAEIEKVVKSALEMAFLDQVSLSQEHFERATQEIVPISVTMRDEIDALRSWANNRARPAGDPFEETRRPVAVDLAPMEI